MRNIIRYVFITLMLVTGLILALPLAGLRKNLDTELSKPISGITENNSNTNKKNIQLFNVLGLALNNQSNQMVILAENKSASSTNKRTDMLVYIPYTIKQGDLSTAQADNNISDISKANNQSSNSGTLPVYAFGKASNNQIDKSEVNSASSSASTDNVSKRQAIDTPDPGGSGGGTPLGSLPIGDSNYFIAFLLALMTLYKFKKTSLIG